MAVKTCKIDASPEERGQFLEEASEFSCVICFRSAFPQSRLVQSYSDVLENKSVASLDFYWQAASQR